MNSMKTNLNSLRKDCLLMFGIAGIVIGANWCALAADGHWVTTWGCGPQLTEPGNLPPAPYSTNSMSHCTLRQFVRATIGGKLIRVRLSNAYGTELVNINSMRVALSAGAGSAGNGDINTGTIEARTDLVVEMIERGLLK